MMRILALRVWQCIALALVGFSLYTAAVGQFVDPVQRSTHLALALALAFTLGIKSGNWFDSKRRALTDVILAISGFALVGYITGNNEGLTERMRESLEFEIWLGIGATVLAIEATRRVIGWPMVILALAAIGYAFAGPYLPEPLDHRGYSLERIVSHLYLGDDGIFGIPLGVSATYVALIVTFGALLESSGAGRVLMDVATAMTGRSRGGPAESRRGRQQPHGNDIGDRGRQCADHGDRQHPVDAPHRLSPEGRSRHRGGRFHRRPDHAADHGRGCIHHGRADPAPL